MNGSLLLVEDCLHLWTVPTGLPAYDFAFERLLACRHPWRPDPEIPVLLRAGPLEPPDAGLPDPQVAAVEALGLRLLHDTEARRRASLLSGWYPHLAGLTPESLWGPDLTPERVGDVLGWPVFVKGERQTSRHQRRLHIVPDAASWVSVMAAWQHDPILCWQRPVARRLLRLRPVPAATTDPARLPASFEWRVFCWRGEVVALGRYWTDAGRYALTAAEEDAVRALATEAARRLAVPFLVVDVAQDLAGRWWVIECNDGQEAGMAGISPLALWQAVVARERSG